MIERCVISYMKYHHILLLFGCLLLGLKANGQNTTVLQQHKTQYPLNYDIEILADSSGKLTLTEVLLPENQRKFKPNRKEQVNHGYSKAHYWMRINLNAQNIDLKEFEWFLHFDNPNIDTLVVYMLSLRGDVLKAYTTGDRFPFSSRPVSYYHFLFPITFDPTQNTTLYIYASGYYSKNHSLSVVEQAQVMTDLQYKIAFAIVLNAILVALILYNFLLFLGTKDPNYGYYVAYLFSVLGYMLSISGLGYQYFYPDYPVLGNFLPNTFVYLTILSSSLFAYHFLRLKTILPLWAIRFSYLYLAIGTAIYVVFTYLFFYMPHWVTQTFLPLALHTLFGLTCFILIGFWAFRRGVPSAKFFLLAWLMLIFGAMLTVLRTIGFNVPAMLVNNGIQIGAVVEALLLSLGLADKIKTIEHERRQAQKQMIEALQENEKIIREQNTLLEYRVQERTQELAASNEELFQTNEELQTTLDVVNQQKKQIENKSQAITNSINYAKRIQEALLPNEDQVRLMLPESFIFFVPRDIVSGDFYFFAQHPQDQRIAVAAIDCTGHGVPGAFMSLIAKEILDQIIIEKNIWQTDQILNELHKAIRKSLKQEETTNRDGMDLSLVVLDKTQRKLQFSGAKNPLLYIQNGQLQHIKPDKMPIGGVQREQERLFTQQEISLTEQPTYLYLFTDGFPDQFGGRENKKFGLANLKQNLLLIHQQTMETQKQHLAETFQRWVGANRQIDDVLLIGLQA